MHKRIDLANGPLNGSDRLIIELIEPPHAADGGDQLASQTNGVHTSAARRVVASMRILSATVVGAAIMWLMVGPRHPTTGTTLRTALTEQSRYQEIAWNT